MADVNVALIGYAFMGRAHSNAWRQVGPFFSPKLTPRMKVICGRNAKNVKAAAAQLGWDEAATDWLARLNAIGARSGVQIRSADYRMQKTGTRLERYEVVLPLTGSYPQIRAFLGQALAEIPVLSLDQVTIKRERAQGGAVQAEARMTLHLARP